MEKISDRISKRYTTVFKKQLRNIIVSRLSQLNKYRVKIDTGFTCNLKCSYCYYLHKVNDPFIDSEIIYDQILKAKSLGFKKIEFSGGESSIHPDFIKWVQFCTDNNLECSMLSNGYSIDLENSVNAGLSEILFSIHGYEETHNNVTKNSKSYKKLINSIKKANQLGVRVRLNIIIHDFFKEDDLEKVLEDLKEVDVYQFNFLPINTWDDAKKYFEKLETYDNIIDTLSKSLDTLYKNFQEPNINIRYFPYCLVKEKYRKHIVTHLDHFFDEDDWPPDLTHRRDIDNIFKKQTEYAKTPEEILELLEIKRTVYHKTKKCLTCEYMAVCDGYKK